MLEYFTAASSEYEFSDETIDTGGSRKYQHKTTLRAHDPKTGEQAGELEYYPPHRKNAPVHVIGFGYHDYDRKRGAGSALLDEMQSRHPGSRLVWMDKLYEKNKPKPGDPNFNPNRDYGLPTNWDIHYPKLPGSIHRGLGISLEPHEAREVNSTDVPVGEQAKTLYRHVQNQGSIGMHWSADPNKPHQFAFRNALDPRTDVPVVLHAETPERKDIETRPDVLRNKGVWPHEHISGDAEVPIIKKRPVKVTGISWLPDVEHPEADENGWVHHTFEEPQQHIASLDDEELFPRKMGSTLEDGIKDYFGGGDGRDQELLRTAGRGKPRHNPSAGSSPGGAAPQGAAEDPGQGADAGDAGEGGAGLEGPRPVEFHPRAVKDLAKLDGPMRKRAKKTIDALANGEPGLQTHALYTSLAGWSSTKINHDHRVVHRNTDEGGIHIIYVGLHGYDEASRRTGALEHTIRQVPPEEFSKYHYPDYRVSTLPALVRHFKKTSPDYFNEIRDDVQRNGFTTPVLVRRNGPGGRPLPKPQVMEGHHRAAVAYDLGMPLPVGDYDNPADYDIAFQAGQPWFREHQRPSEGVSWKTSAKTDVCPCGLSAVLDPVDGWQHADGSVSHDGEHYGKSVSDLMENKRSKKAAKQDVMYVGGYLGDIGREQEYGDFRRVLYTSPKCQLTAMTLQPGESIGKETHNDVDQILILIEGEGECLLGGNVQPFVGEAVLCVPQGTEHNITNTGKAPMRLATVYAPAHHAPGTVHHTKADAKADRGEEYKPVKTAAAKPFTTREEQDQFVHDQFGPTQEGGREEVHPKSGWKVEVGEHRRIAKPPEDQEEGPLVWNVSDYGELPNRPLFPRQNIRQEPVTHVFRGVSTDEWKQAQERGYLKSDQRGTLADWEGTNAAVDPRSAVSYLPYGGSGHVLKIRVHPEDKWFTRHEDSYARTREKIPLDRIEHVSPLLHMSDRGQLSREAKRRPKLKSRVFGPTKGALDPRLFEGDRMRPEVRTAVLSRLGPVLEPLLGKDWERFTKVYLAGSESSEWYGNNDFDTLIGVDFDHLGGEPDVPVAGEAEDHIIDMLNTALRVSYNAEPWEAPFGGSWSLTGYCNKNSYDIAKIKPYAAYDISGDEWAVRPPHLPEWHFDQHPLYKPLLAEMKGYADAIEAIDAMPEPFRTQQGRALWEHLHSDRGRAFSGEGTGWDDPGNLVEKALVEWGLWDKLVDIRYGKQKTAGAQGDAPSLIFHHHDYGDQHQLIAEEPDNGEIGYLSWSKSEQPTGEVGENCPTCGRHIWEEGHAHPAGEIEDIDVNPLWRRRGVGRAMLEHARSMPIEPKPVHSQVLTDEGRAWAEKTASKGEYCETCKTEHDYPFDENDHHRSYTDWDQAYPRVRDEIHRGMAVPLSSHDLVHSDAPEHERAHALLREVTADGAGMHWTDSGPEMASRIADEEVERQYPTVRGGMTHVVLHADKPRREDIEDDIRKLVDGSVISRHSGNPESEVPLKQGAPVNIWGVSWRHHREPGWHFHEFEQPVRKTAGAKVEHVLIDKLWPHREWDHQPGGYSYDREGGGPYGWKHDQRSWEANRQSVADEGIREPLTLEYNPKQHAAYIGEGNHRLHWAREAGHTTVPLRVWRTSKEMHPRYNLPGSSPLPEGEHVPQDLRPSQVLPADWIAERKTAVRGRPTPVELPPEQEAAFDARDYRRELLNLAKNPVPGTHIWRGEVRKGDPLSSDDRTVGIHWSVHPDDVLHQPTFGEGERNVLWHGVVDDPAEQTFDRSHPMWRDHHMSWDKEAEIRLKPGSKVHMKGVWIKDPDHPDPGMPPVPRHPELTGPGWSYHPIGEQVPVAHRPMHPGMIDYTDVGVRHEGVLEYFTAADEGDTDYRMQHRPPDADFGAPLHDLAKVYPEDIYTHSHYYDGGEPGYQEAHSIARRVKGQPDAKVTIYRALPAEYAHQGFRPGDWVSTSKEYARQHGMSHEGPEHDWPVIRTTVPAKHLQTNGDSLLEYGYTGPHKDMPTVSFKGGYHQEIRHGADGMIKPVQRRKPKTASDYRLQHRAPDEDSGKPYHEYFGGHENDPVRIYRAAPHDVDYLDSDTWVTTNPDYAHLHAEQYDGSKKWPVMSAEVPAKHVYWDENDSNEFGYQGPRLEENYLEEHDQEQGLKPFESQAPKQAPARKKKGPQQQWGIGVAHLTPQEHGESMLKLNRPVALKAVDQALSGAEWSESSRRSEDKAADRLNAVRGHGPEGTRPVGVIMRAQNGEVDRVALRHHQDDLDPDHPFSGMEIHRSGSFHDLGEDSRPIGKTASLTSYFEVAV